MRVVLEIERLVLEDPALLPHERELFGRALQDELERRLRESASASGWRPPAARDRLAAAIDPGETTAPEAFGRAVARSLHQALAPSSQRDLS